MKAERAHQDAEDLGVGFSKPDFALKPRPGVNPGLEALEVVLGLSHRIQGPRGAGGGHPPSIPSPSPDVLATDSQTQQGAWPPSQVYPLSFRRYLASGLVLKGTVWFLEAQSG